jgi:hypothetical protein
MVFQGVSIALFRNLSIVLNFCILLQLTLIYDYIVHNVYNIQLLYLNWIVPIFIHVRAHTSILHFPSFFVNFSMVEALPKITLIHYCIMKIVRLFLQLLFWLLIFHSMNHFTQIYVHGQFLIIDQFVVVYSQLLCLFTITDHWSRFLVTFLLFRNSHLPVK